MGTYCIEHWTRDRHPEKALTLWDSHPESETSRQGSLDVRIRKDSQQAQLLAVYAKRVNWGGLTDEEAGEQSGLADRKRCAYWMRCSELRKMGLIADTGVTRTASTGSPQMVCQITMLGMDAAGRMQ